MAVGWFLMWQLADSWYDSWLILDVTVGRVPFGYLAKLRLLSLIVISFPHSVCACERANNDPVGVAKPIIGAWPGDRYWYQNLSLGPGPVIGSSSVTSLQPVCSQDSTTCRPEGRAFRMPAHPIAQPPHSCHRHELLKPITKLFYDNYIRNNSNLIVSWH